MWLIEIASSAPLLALPYRAWNINDLIGNSIGAVLGFGALYVWKQIRRTPG